MEEVLDGIAQMKPVFHHKLFLVDIMDFEHIAFRSKEA